MKKLKLLTAVLITSGLMVACGTKVSNTAHSEDIVTTPLPESYENYQEEPIVDDGEPAVDPNIQVVLDTEEFKDMTPEAVSDLLNQDTYNFNFDSSKLNGRDYKSLNAKIAYLTSELGEGKDIIIQGHTDERGTRTYNLALGERRANAIKRYLEAQGIPSSRIQVISFGFEKPVDSNHNETAWSKNRRAEIIID